MLVFDLLLLNPADVFRILNVFSLDDVRSLYGLTSIVPPALANAVCAPGTLRMMAQFAVLTRLKEPENSSIFSKMQVYDGESLKDTLARALPYYVTEILPRVLRGERVLVSAHGNSLRSLLMVLERATPETIPGIELATGVPVVYRLNADSTVISKDTLTA